MNFKTLGALVQLVVRYTGSVEVRSSSLLCSTTSKFGSFEGPNFFMKKPGLYVQQSSAWIVFQSDDFHFQ